MRVKVGVADDAHRAGHAGDRFPGDLEQARTKIACDAVVGNGASQALCQYALIESVTPAGVAFQHHA